MFDLNSAHLNPQVVELLIELFFHIRSLLSDLVFHTIAIKVSYVHASITNLILSAANILSHLLDLFKLLEQFVSKFSCLENLIGGIHSNLFELLLCEENHAL